MFRRVFLILFLVAQSAISAAQSQTVEAIEKEVCGCLLHEPAKEVGKYARRLPAAVPFPGKPIVNACSVKTSDTSEEQMVAYGIKNEPDGYTSVTWDEAGIARIHDKALAPDSWVGTVYTFSEAIPKESSITIGYQPYKIDDAYIAKKGSTTHFDHRPVFECREGGRRVSTLVSFERLDNGAQALMLPPGKSIAFSERLRPWAKELPLTAGWSREEYVSLGSFKVSPPWSYRHTLVSGGLGLAAGALTQASGGPQWSAVTGTGLGLLYDLGVQIHRRRSARHFASRWLGPSDSGKYLVLRNNSGQDQLEISKDRTRGMAAEGSVLLFQTGNSDVIGTKIAVTY